MKRKILEAGHQINIISIAHLIRMCISQAQSRHNLDIKTLLALGGPAGLQRVIGRKLLRLLGLLEWRKCMGIEPTHQLVTGTLDLKS